MKKLIVITFFLFVGMFSVQAQQRLEPGAMNYIVNPKPNMILYHDTLYRGRNQFEMLFYRTRNQDLIRLLEKHQTNKVAGQVLGVVGTLSLIFGISEVSSSTGNKSAGWVMIGSGFATTIAGGYLTLMGQKNLNLAITLFNQQQHKSALGIGIGDKQAGLVYKF